MGLVNVLVIGSGAAGLCAAVSASEAGVERILVAEGEGEVGGSSRLSGGLIMGAGTRHQAALGIEDSGAELFHDYLAVNRWNVDVGIVRALCDTSGHVVDWLADLGVEDPRAVRVSGRRSPGRLGRVGGTSNGCARSRSTRAWPLGRQRGCSSRTRRGRGWVQ